MDLTEFAWRDGVLLVAVAVGVYIAITLLRLAQIGKRRERSLVFHAGTEFAANDAGAASPESATKQETVTELPFDFPLLPPSGRIPVEDAAPPPDFAVAPAPTFAEKLSATRLEQEVRELRTQLDALREELAEVQASRRVSPQYADAMALAQRGFDAQGIAEHCAISRGEAELVMALAQGHADNRGADGEMKAEDDYVGTEHRGFATGR